MLRLGTTPRVKLSCKFQYHAEAVQQPCTKCLDDLSLHNVFCEPSHLYLYNNRERVVMFLDGLLPLLSRRQQTAPISVSGACYDDCSKLVLWPPLPPTPLPSSPWCVKQFAC